MTSDKLLEWEAYESEGEPDAWYARTPHGTFFVEAYNGKFAMYSSNGPKVRYYPTAEIAKFAASLGMAAKSAQ